MVERSEWVGLVLAQPCVEHSLQKLGGFAITALAAEWFAQRSIKIANPHRRRLPSVFEAMQSFVQSLGYNVSTFGSAEEFLNSEQRRAKAT